MPKTSDGVEHLWVIVTDVDPISRKAVCVNVTTLRGHSDMTCILKAGDHPFVRHDSVIHYPDTREIPIDVVERALAINTDKFVCRPHHPCSSSLLARIQQGLLDSKKTPKDMKARCRLLWGR